MAKIGIGTNILIQSRCLYSDGRPEIHSTAKAGVRLSLPSLLLFLSTSPLSFLLFCLIFVSLIPLYSSCSARIHPLDT
ncbi:hypothetical protein BDW72DRAFT_183849 [Aspergillus terricola var. indicus]